MARPLLNLATTLSVLLCAAAVILWVRSYFVSDEVTWRIDYVDVPTGRVSNTASHFVRSSRGRWSIGDFHSDFPRPADIPRRTERHQAEWTRSPDPLTLDFVASRFGGQTPVPYWLTALAFAALPTWRLAWPRVRRWVHRRCQDRAGHCPGCGYDLRATPDRCPECGTAAAATP